ncbi:peptidase, partial [Pseudomonas aeruginosa]|uniref:peptidase n=1 Tax=Pseudomonas aeruginosa TaxID=287 RepID=UPI0008775F10
MTYCVAMHLADGLVFASDSRTNAGIDHIATFRKLFTFGTPGERLLVAQTAGNLATSQSVINLLQQRIRRDGASLLNVPSVYDATALVAETTREVMARDGGNLAGNTDLSCSFLVGGQIAGGPPALYSIYPQGNFIQATPDTPFLQLGESKYGKPILDRNLTFDTPLEQA